MKRLVHRLLRASGYDVFRLANVDAFIAQRERERQQAYSAALRRLREEQASRGATGPSPAPSGAVWVKPEELTGAAARLLLPAATVLDIGCGIRPQQLVDARVHICCEPCKDYMDRLILETQTDPRYVYLQCDLEAATRLFPACSVDTAFLIDVIEHLPREAGLVRLRQLRSIVRRQVVVLTPLGFMPQQYPGGRAGPWGMDGTELQEHRSAWTPEDFPAGDGWRVLACRDFHRGDAHGRPLPEPCGAMWAVWTAPEHRNVPEPGAHQ